MKSTSHLSRQQLLLKVMICGVFSKSAFTQRLLDVAAENPGLLLVNEDKLM